MAATQPPRSHREPGRPLPAALLYQPCDVTDLPFELVSELEDPLGPIGQDRAVEAVEFTVRTRRKGYNIYALGPSGTGKHTVIEQLLRRRADGMPTPPDWCYVNNFTDPQKPHRLQLPPGRATGLREAMRRLVEELRAALPAAFERDDYRARREVIDQRFRQRNEQAFGELQRRAEQKGIAMLRTPMGLALAPRRDGKVLTPEMFEGLPEAERERIQHAIGGVNEKIEGFFDACQITGFTGRQGVIIPASNIKHLMLRQDVVAAAEEERFRIFPIETVDQGLSLLTGLPAGEPDADGNYPAGTLNHRIAARLDAFAAKAAELARTAAGMEARK